MSMLRGFPVPTAWRVLGLRMEDSCEYIGKAAADKRQGVVLQLGVWAWGLQTFTVKK
jgi:hypothetical protein